MKIKRLLLCFMIMFLGMAAIFTGCDLVQTDTRLYYDAVVAEVGDIQVTKLELLNTYYTVLQYGYTNVSVDDLLKQLVERKVLINEIKTNFKTYIEGLGEQLEDETLTGEELYALDNVVNKHFYNEVMQKVYDYLDKQIVNYQNAIRTAKGLAKIEDDEDDEKDPTDYSTPTVYEKKVEYDGETWKRVFEAYEFEAEKIGSQDPEAVSGFLYSENNHGDDDATRRLAYQRFIQGLIRSEKGKNLDTNERNVLQREIDRLYKVYADSEYEAILEDYYTKVLFMTDEDVNQRVVNKYRELVQNSYTNYMLAGTPEKREKSYIASMQSDASTVYYHPYDNDNTKGFLKVAHILIKFTDYQLCDIEDDNYESYYEIKKQYEADNDFDAYQSKLAIWLADCSAKARYSLADQELDETHIAGNEYGEAVNYIDIYNEIRTALEGLSEQERADKITEFVYKYSQDANKQNDTNVINFTKYYAISIDPEVEENWVDGFAETARELFNSDVANEGNGRGLLGTVDNIVAVGPDKVVFEEVKNENDELTGIKVKSGYAGYHIIYVVGKYTNVGNIEIENIENLDASFAQTLYATRIMEGVDKSYYDLVYEMLSYSKYNKYTDQITQNALEGKEIKYYKSYYSDLVK